MTVVSLLFLLGNVLNCYASDLVPQRPLDGSSSQDSRSVYPCSDRQVRFPRVDAASHPKLTVTMKEIDQARCCRWETVNVALN